MKAAMRFAVAVFCFFSISAAVAQPPIASTPGYQHDRFVTLPRDHAVEFQAYLSSFDTMDDDDGDGEPEARGVPEFVAYELRAGEPTGKATRPNKWRKVPALPDDVPAPADESYAGSGYSRGHMCMREHAHRLGAAANYHTFNLANACPQLQPFNNGHWKGLENQTAEWADAYGKVWIICGPVFHNKSPEQWIGDEDEVPVAIPGAYFKIVVRESADPKRPYVLAFKYKHDENLSSSSKDIDHSAFLVSVDTIEAETGLDFFTSLSSRDQAAIESRPADELWPTEDRPHRERLAKKAEPGAAVGALTSRGRPKMAVDEAKPSSAPSSGRRSMAESTSEYLNGIAAFIPDGDTLHLRQGNQVQKVRFYGVDAPESDQDFGQEATEFTRNLIGDRPVTVRIKERDQYGRFVGEVFVDGKSVNRELARKGLAWWYERYAEGDLDMKRLEEGAKRNRLGLWSQENPVPPWEWRRRE